MILPSFLISSKGRAWADAKVANSSTPARMAWKRRGRVMQVSDATVWVVMGRSGPLQGRCRAPNDSDARPAWIVDSVAAGTRAAAIVRSRPGRPQRNHVHVRYAPGSLLKRRSMRSARALHGA